MTTIAKNVSWEGESLFSKEKVKITFHPAPPSTGIVFRRVDLPQMPHIPAKLSSVIATPRTTILEKDGIRIATVEHLLSALSAFGISDLWVDVEGAELPIGDGSAMPFISMLEQAGICFKGERRWLSIDFPIFYQEGETLLLALPSDRPSLTYFLEYPKEPLLQASSMTYSWDLEEYKEKIGRARTFCLYEEYVMMQQKGILQEGQTKGGLVVAKDRLLGADSFHFPREPAAHKLLDLMGDLFLSGHFFLADIIAVKSGHRTNIEFAKRLELKAHELFA